MLSRYIHFRCTCIHSSITSEMRLSFSSQPLTSCVNGLTNRLAIIDCSVSDMSSRMSVVSSTERRMNPRSSGGSPFMYLMSSNFCSFHTASNRATSASILSSFSAAMHISITGSWNRCSSSPNRAPSVNVLGSTSKSSGWRVIRTSCAQCRGRNASDLSASMSGREFLNAATRSSTSSNTGFFPNAVSAMLSTRSVKSFDTACSFFKSSSAQSVPACASSACLCATYTAYTSASSPSSFSASTSSGYDVRSSSNRRSASRSSSRVAFFFSSSAVNVSRETTPSSRTTVGSPGPSAFNRSSMFTQSTPNAFTCLIVTSVK